MIHQYKNNGYDIIMDVNSGAVHVVEDVVYDAVALMAQEMPELEKPKAIPSQLAEKVKNTLKRPMHFLISKMPCLIFRN